MAKIACITTFKAIAGKRDELAEYCKAQAPLFVDAEPGTLRIEVLVPHNDPDTVTVWDVYASAEAIQAHREGETLRKFLDGAKSMLLSMTGIRHNLIE